MARSRTKLEFGDFQTPRPLADRVCGYLWDEGIAPTSVVEPTCGTGTFILSALRTFSCATKVIGVERNPDYRDAAKAAIRRSYPNRTVDLRLQDFFDVDWEQVLRVLPDPILVLGNPPWVTSARVGSLAGSNIPSKSNFMQLRGMDAKTGKSNFDIAEWMVIRLWECLKNRDACLALLMKTSVARRILQYVWSVWDSTCEARLLLFDAMKVFSVSADAGVLVLRTRTNGCDKRCDLSRWDDWGLVHASFGMRDDALVADLDAHDRTRSLRSPHPHKQVLRWRSGVKHDCAPVLELRRIGSTLHNQMGDVVNVEPEWVFPLSKGSAIANGKLHPGATSGRFVIIPQLAPGDDTQKLAKVAPRLWDYLSSHSQYFDRRRSSIYRGRAPFAVFGVGPYTFQPWKVGICGLYKRFVFALIPPQEDRPVVLDDTSYQLSFQSEAEARLVLEMLHSAYAQDFFAARVFWDAKRPITAGLLQQLDLLRLAAELGRADEWDRLTKHGTLFGIMGRSADA